MSDNNGWTLYHDYNGEYEEKICPFLIMTVIFSIKHYKRSETILSFTESSSSEKTNITWHRYKVKGNVDYAKKIAENTVKEFENIPIDCDDIDLFFRKTFSLKKINPRIKFPRLTRR